MNSTEVRKIRGFKCDFCHKDMIAGHELVLNNLTWEELCKKAGSPWAPENTLLCPECIEKLMGRPIVLEDLLIKWKNGLIGPVPMNTWYMRMNGMLEEAKPYIIESVKHNRFAREVWKKAGVEV